MLQITEGKTVCLSDIRMTSAMASASTSSKSEFLVNGKYRLIRKIGSGSFGDIYLGINVSNGEVN